MNRIVTVVAALVAAYVILTSGRAQLHNHCWNDAGDTQ